MGESNGSAAFRPFALEVATARIEFCVKKLCDTDLLKAIRIPLQQFH